MNTLWTIVPSSNIMLRTFHTVLPITVQVYTKHEHNNPFHLYIVYVFLTAIDWFVRYVEIKYIEQGFISEIWLDTHGFDIEISFFSKLGFFCSISKSCY